MTARGDSVVFCDFNILDCHDSAFAESRNDGIGAIPRNIPQIYNDDSRASCYFPKQKLENILSSISSYKNGLLMDSIDFKASLI